MTGTDLVEKKLFFFIDDVAVKVFVKYQKNKLKSYQQSMLFSRSVEKTTLA